MGVKGMSVLFAGPCYAFIFVILNESGPCHTCVGLAPSLSNQQLRSQSEKDQEKHANRDFWVLCEKSHDFTWVNGVFSLRLSEVEGQL